MDKQTSMVYHCSHYYPDGFDCRARGLSGGPSFFQAVDALKAKLRANIEDKKKRMKLIAWKGPYDRVYDEGLSALERQPTKLDL